MINRHTVSLVALSLFFVACGGTKPPPATPSPPASESASAEPAPPMPEAGTMGDAGADEDAAAAAPAAPAAPAALDKPASEATVAGASLSSIDTDALTAALKKHHWKADNVKATTTGVYETVHADISKGKMKGTLEIVRPAKSPTATSATVKAPADLKTEDEKKKMAVYYDETGDVLVAVNVEKKGWAAKGLLRQLVKKAKAKHMARKSHHAKHHHKHHGAKHAKKKG